MRQAEIQDTDHPLQKIHDYGKGGRCTFPTNALRSKILTKRMDVVECKTGGQFVNCAKITHH